MTVAVVVVSCYHKWWIKDPGLSKISIFQSVSITKPASIWSLSLKNQTWNRLLLHNLSSSIYLPGMLIDSECSKALLIVQVAAGWNFDHKNVTWVGTIVVVTTFHIFCSWLTLLKHFYNNNFASAIEWFPLNKKHICVFTCRVPSLKLKRQCFNISVLLQPSFGCNHPQTWLTGILLV